MIKPLSDAPLNECPSAHLQTTLTRHKMPAVIGHVSKVILPITTEYFGFSSSQDWSTAGEHTVGNFCALHPLRNDGQLPFGGDRPFYGPSLIAASKPGSPTLIGLTLRLSA